MNLSTMRLLLRRRLQEDVPGRWADADLDRLLNLGITETQKRIYLVDPDALFFIDRCDQVKDQEFYERPAGCWTLADVRVKDASSGAYTSLGDPIAYRETVGRIESTVAWAPFSTHFVISPKPSENVVDGIEVVWVPTVTVAADTDVPIIHQALHVAPVLFAERFAVGDTGEDGAAIDKELTPIINSIPQFYQRVQGPLAFRVSGVDR